MFSQEKHIVVGFDLDMNYIWKNSTRSCVKYGEVSCFKFVSMLFVLFWMYELKCW